MQTAYAETAELVLKSPPSIAWQLMILATINPDHGVFAKDFIKPQRARPASNVSALSVPNVDGFFDGLPVSKSKGKRMALMTKEMREQVKREKMEKRLQQLQEQLGRPSENHVQPVVQNHGMVNAEMNAGVDDGRFPLVN